MTREGLARHIERSIAAQGSQVEHIVFGTDDPHAVARLFDEWTRRQLGAAVEAARWYRVSVGAVAALTLAGGRDVVVKALPPRYPARFVAAARQAQAHLAAHGFPAPVPVGAPAPIGRGIAGAETLLHDPGARVPAARARPQSAAALARIVELAAQLPADQVEGLSPHPLDTPGDGALYPEPHNPMFDFTIDTAATRHVDALARQAVRVRALDDHAPVVAHTDFAARNVRFEADGVCAVFDWDSLAIVAESVAVAQAAVTWNALAEPGEALAPSPEEVAGYVRDYERASGAPFTAVQWAAAGGAALWVLAYSARCELSLGPAAGHRRCHGRLLADGPRYLEPPFGPPSGASSGTPSGPPSGPPSGDDA